MALVKRNDKVGKDAFLLEIEGKFAGYPGQFYMIKVGDRYPLLSRPISIFEITDDSIKFLYKIVGEGTKMLSEIKRKESIAIRGPYGNGFPMVHGRIALVGGGMGAAPLFETGKRLLNSPDITAVDLFLGFAEEIFLKDQWQRVCNSFFYAIGGFITDSIDVSQYDYVFCCGPDVMMEKLTLEGKRNGVEVYVSKESHMACGIGVCLVCNCSTKDGNKKVCKDGPVFLGEEVYEV